MFVGHGAPPWWGWGSGNPTRSQVSPLGVTLALRGHPFGLSNYFYNRVPGYFDGTGLGQTQHRSGPELIGVWGSFWEAQVPGTLGWEQPRSPRTTLLLPQGSPVLILRSGRSAQTLLLGAWGNLSLDVACPATQSGSRLPD